MVMLMPCQRATVAPRRLPQLLSLPFALSLSRSPSPSPSLSLPPPPHPVTPGVTRQMGMDKLLHLNLSHNSLERLHPKPETLNPEP